MVDFFFSNSRYFVDLFRLLPTSLAFTRYEQFQITHSKFKKKSEFATFLYFCLQSYEIRKSFWCWSCC